MRDEVVIALILVLVIASAGAGYFVGGSGGRTVTTTATTTQAVSTTVTTFTITSVSISLGCSRPYSNYTIMGTKSNSSVVVLDMNFTSWLCVNVFNGYGEGITTPDFPLTASILQGGNWVASNNLNVTVTPQAMQIPAGGVGWMEFAIVPNNLTQAIYFVGLPVQCWGRIIVGVGYSIAYLESLRLMLPSSLTTCPAIDGFSEVASTTNLIPVYTK